MMKTKLTLFVALLAAALFVGGCASTDNGIAAKPKYDFTDGLIAYYPLNGDAKDAGGNGLHGEPTNCKFVRVGSDPNNKAASFSGNGWIELPRVSSDEERKRNLNFGAGDFTYSAWIKTPHKQYARIVAQDWDSRMCRSISLRDGGKERSTISVSFLVSDDEEDSGIVTTGNNVTDNKWHHVVGVRKDIDFFLAIDGSVVAETRVHYAKVNRQKEVGSSDANAPVRIGARKSYKDAHTPYKGLIDNVRIYNRALSADEVKALYDLEKPKGK